jgi:nucleotide-binding universal stress UspA family protein
MVREMQQARRVMDMKVGNILVPVDFSPPSLLAVNHGVSLARAFRAKLTLLHVVESIPPAQAFSEIRVDVEERDRYQVARLLSALVSSEDQDDLDLRVVVRVGDIKDEIADAIREKGADLLVMGTHGRGLFGRWIVGSITEGILRNIEIPILTVCRAAKPLAFERIVFATDLSDYAKEAFDFALELAGRMHSELFILHVLDQTRLAYGTPEVGGALGEQDVEEAKTKLAALAAEVSAAKLHGETSLVVGPPADEILKAAEITDADIVLIGVHKRRLIERALLGTTAERVVREARVPVLSIPVGLASHSARRGML